jgi:glc operon protein GlcG
MRVLILMAATVGLCLGAAAQAQQPAPPPPVTAPASPAPPPEYGEAVTSAQAKMAAEAALSEAQKNNWRMAVTIVGPDGELVYFEKMDGTQNASAALALAKARTSALFRRPSKAFAEQFAAGNTGFMTFPDQARPIASEGGLPIVMDGKIIGAIGASGGTAAQDGMAAAAGVGALK